MLRKSTIQNKQCSFIEKKHGPQKSYSAITFLKD